MASDLVFCRTWYNVNVPKFYNPVTNLLLPSNDKCAWLGMKTCGQLKKEKGIKGEPQVDSLYTPVTRKPRVFKPLKIPKRLQRELPYKDRPKVLKIGPKDDQKKQRVAIIRDAHEYKVASVLKMLRANFREKQKKQKEETRKRVLEHKQKIQMEEQHKQKRIDERRKGLFIKQTKQKAKMK